MKSSHLILLLALNCGWASVPTLATRLTGRVGPVEFVFLRYAFAFVALVLVWPWLPGRLPRGRDFWRACLMGVAVFNLGHLAQIAGIQRSQASDSSILLALDPLVSTIGAALFLQERVPGRRWLGFGLGMLGVGLLSLWHRAAPLPGLIANCLIVLSFIAEACWSVVGKPLIGRWGIPKVAALALAAGTLANAATLALLPTARPHALPALSSVEWVTLAALGVVFTAFGYCIWFVVIRETPVSLASLTIYLQPVIGTVLAFRLTSEQPHFGHLLGAATILAGLLIGITGPNEAARAEKA